MNIPRAQQGYALRSVAHTQKCLTWQFFLEPGTRCQDYDVAEVGMAENRHLGTAEDSLGVASRLELWQSFFGSLHIYGLKGLITFFHASTVYTFTHDRNQSFDHGWLLGVIGVSCSISLELAKLHKRLCLAACICLGDPPAEHRRFNQSH